MVFSIIEIYYITTKFPNFGLILGISYNIIGLTKMYSLNGFDSIYFNSVYAYQIATIISLIVIFKYVKSVEATKKELKKISITDSLTDVYNSRYYKNQIKDEFLKCKKNGKNLGLIIFDIDDFKMINDVYGHSKGDFVLQVLAKEIDLILEKNETLYRYGGDEFIVLVSNYEKDYYREIARKIIKKINKLNDLNKFQINHKIHISIGIALFSSDLRNHDQLFRKADKALYRAKEIEGSIFEIENNG